MSVQSLVWIPSSNRSHWNQHGDFSALNVCVGAHWENPLWECKKDPCLHRNLDKRAFFWGSYCKVLANLQSVCVCGSAERHLAITTAAERRSQFGLLCTTFALSMQTAIPSGLRMVKLWAAESPSLRIVSLLRFGTDTGELVSIQIHWIKLCHLMYIMCLFVCLA